MKRFAAIDVGATSVHLLVADDGGAIVDESTFAGLGEAVDATGLLGSKTDELATVLSDYAGRAAAASLILATSPFRRAPDAARVVRRLADQGLAVHVLSEREEALLTLVGATGGRRPGGPVAVVDIGGGSTEVVAARPDQRPIVTAVDLGAARLTGRWAPADPPGATELEAKIDDARFAFTGVVSVDGGRMLAVGGTADNLARLTGSDRLGREDLQRLLDLLAGSPSADLAASHGLRPARVRLLPAGASILLALLERWGIEAVDVSSAGLREGAVLAYAEAGEGWRDRLERLSLGWRP
jgi:exopolyphosphatase/guanosine-5'-triphosphate,3'-diphosphate pyrophosphatase